MMGKADEALRRAGTIRVVLAAAIAALLLRCGWMVLRPLPPDGDERIYLALAQNLAQHLRFSIQPGGPLEGHFGPAFTALQALLMTAGLPVLLAGKVVSLVAGSLAAALVYPLGLRLWGRPSAAGIATAAAILHPGMAGASRHLYPEALSSLFLLLAVFSLMAGRWGGIACGASLAVACLTRRESVILVPFAIALLLLRPAARGPTGARLAAGGRRAGRVQAGALALTFTLLFGPYLLYVRAVSGHWTLSSRANYSWIVGRLMEDRPGEGLSLEEIRRLEATYPSPIDYLRAHPWKTVAALARSSWFHLKTAFTAWHSWPIGILSLAGLATALMSRRLRAWPLPALLLPFLLVFAWSTAGPILRYSKALGPFVCLLAGAVARPLPFRDDPVPATAVPHASRRRTSGAGS
jgi:hypothetical protein